MVISERSSTTASGGAALKNYVNFSRQVTYLLFKVLSSAALTTVGGAISSATSATAANLTHHVHRPALKPADLTKPVKVFILIGQSNMFGVVKRWAGQWLNS